MAIGERNIDTIVRDLPKDIKQEVLDFIDFLLTRSEREKSRAPKETGDVSENLDPSKDPLLELSGFADVEPFAEQIDEHLYGRVNEGIH